MMVLPGQRCKDVLWACDDSSSIIWTRVEGSLGLAFNYYIRRKLSCLNFLNAPYVLQGESSLDIEAC